MNSVKSIKSNPSIGDQMRLVNGAETINGITEDDSKCGYKITHIHSGEKAWWMNGGGSETDSSKKNEMNKYKIRRIESGEKAWWMQDEANKHEDDEVAKVEKLQCTNEESEPEQDDNEQVSPSPLGDRASPEGLEDNRTMGRHSPYDNVPDTSTVPEKGVRPIRLFISSHKNIDDLLGGGGSSMFNP